MTLMSTEDFIREALQSAKIPSDSKDKFVPEFTPRTAEFGTNKRKKRHISENVADWITYDFVTYTRNAYERRYDKSWSLNSSAQCKEIFMVRDEVVDRLGFCDNITLKKYID